MHHGKKRKVSRGRGTGSSIVGERQHIRHSEQDIHKYETGCAVHTRGLEKKSTGGKSKSRLRQEDPTQWGVSGTSGKDELYVLWAHMNPPW